MPNRRGGRNGGWGGSMLRRELERYLGPREHLLYVCRRHPIVLEAPAVAWFVSGALYVVAVQESGDGGIRVVGRVVLLAGTSLFVYKFGEWWRWRYILTNQRVLLIQGVLSRRVSGLLLKLIIDTTYRRTLGGRLFGYGDLELNLAGQPGLRKLTMLPRPDVMYRLIVSLTGDGDVTPGDDGEAGPNAA